VRERRCRRNRQVLRLGTEPLAEIGAHAEDLVAGSEPADLGADLDDRAGELVAQNPCLRATPAARRALHEGRATTPGAVVAVDGRGVDPDEDLAAGRGRPLDLVDAQDLGWSVSVQDGGSHASHAVMMTCPATEPLPTAIPLWSGVARSTRDLRAL
jgi:hypothetical protein